MRFAREALATGRSRWRRRWRWPKSASGAGDAAGARRAWPRADARQLAETPWLRPWEWLLEAQRDDLEGRREEAVRQYKKVLQEPFRRRDLEGRAEAGIKGAFSSSAAAAAAADGRPRADFNSAFHNLSPTSEAWRVPVQKKA